MNLYNNEGIITLFKSGSLGSPVVKRTSDKNVINILNSLPQDEVKKIINLKMIANHLHYNSSVKRYNILNKYFDFQSFSDEGKADFIFKCLFINNPNILKSALSLFNDSVLQHFKNSFISNFYYINLKCNLSPHFYLLKDTLSQKQFKEIEPYLLYIITYDSKVHFSSMFSQALNTNDYPDFQKKMNKKIYDCLSNNMYSGSVLNIDFSNPDFYTFYIKNNILNSANIFKNIVLYSKHDTAPYFQFLAAQNISDSKHLLENLIKENQGYFLNDLQERINIILKEQWKDGHSSEKEIISLQEAFSRFLKPLSYVSEEKLTEIVNMYFNIYKNSSIYIPDNKEVMDEHYKNMLIAELNRRLNNNSLNQDSFTFSNFNSALQQFTSLKEKELIVSSLTTDHISTTISTKRL